MENFSNRDLIVETVNKLFVFTDAREWQKIQDQVMCADVHFDMRSVGAQEMDTTAIEICKIWETGFKEIDSVYHLAGNYLVDIQDNHATVFAYATASHFKKTAVNGQTREFIGSYDIGLKLTSNGWRINAFAYHLKFMTGNKDLS